MHTIFALTATTLCSQHSSRARQPARTWAESNVGMASLLSQSARSGRLTLPVSDSTRSPLSTRPEVRRWAEPQTPPLGTPPRRVGVAPPTVRLSNGGRPGNHAMVPTNQEASGQGKRPLPPREKGGDFWTNVRRLVSSCRRRLLSSRPVTGVCSDLVFWSRVAAGLLALVSSLALGSSRAGGACWSPTLSSVPGACSGIELRVRAPPIQDVKDRTRREGPFRFFWVCVCLWARL